VVGADELDWHLMASMLHVLRYSVSVKIWATETMVSDSVKNNVNISRNSLVAASLPHPEPGNWDVTMCWP
jgi:hypothetical protein